MSTPHPPINVRIEHADGTRTPVEVVYVGERDGMHHWGPRRDDTFMRRGETIGVDVLPSMTAVSIPLGPPARGEQPLPVQQPGGGA